MNYKKLYLLLVIMLMGGSIIYFMPKYQQLQKLLAEEMELQSGVNIAKQAVILAKPPLTFALKNTMQQIFQLASQSKLVINSYKKIDHKNILQLQGADINVINFLLSLCVNYPIDISDITIEKIDAALSLNLSFDLLQQQMKPIMYVPRSLFPNLFCQLNKNFDFTTADNIEFKNVGYIEQGGKHVSLLQLPNDKVVLK